MGVYDFVVLSFLSIVQIVYTVFMVIAIPISFRKYVLDNDDTDDMIADNPVIKKDNLADEFPEF